MIDLRKVSARTLPLAEIDRLSVLDLAQGVGERIGKGFLVTDPGKEV
jgi:hypothetical protein